MAMVEVQCTSCHTRYRINQRLLPDGTPTFKCSRCGHVFVLEPRSTEVRRPKAAESAPSDIVQPASEAEEDIANSPTVVSASSASSAAEPAPKTVGCEKENPADQLESSLEEQTAEPESGQPLTFDFENEAAAETEAETLDSDVRDGDDWEIGGDADEPPRRGKPPAESTWRKSSAARSSYQAPEPKGKMAPFPVAAFERQIRARAALLRERPGKVHSATLFLGVFLLAVVVYGAMSMIVVGAPAASVDFFGGLPVIGSHFARPALAASLVALTDVKAAYAHLKDGRSALVIAGIARNVGPTPLHAVEIDADLDGGGPRPLARTHGYCGTNLSPSMVSQMTPREIEFLEGIGPAHDFALAPEGRCSFALVFLNPPQTARHFSLIVARAAVETTGARQG